MWKYYQPVEVIFGEGEIQNLGKYMGARGMNRALLIADPFIEKSGLAEKIAEASDGKVLGIVSEVEPNPTIQNVDQCAKKARELKAECLIAVGGGSAMDCAKSTAAAVKQQCTARELMDGLTIREALPVVAIPTTAGTGSEVTAGAVLSDKENEQKIALFGNALFPSLSIVDPQLTYSCPTAVTARSGIDVIAHALDAMTSVKSNPATDALAVKAARLAFENLEKAVADGNDKEARKNMSMASVIAGLAFSQTGTTGSHACSYILTSKYHLPHGEACAFTLDFWFRENAKVKPELEEYAVQLGFTGVEEVCTKISEMKDTFGFCRTLADAGIAESDLEIVIKSSMASGNMVNNIAQIGYEGVKRLFEGLK